MDGEGSVYYGLAARIGEQHLKRLCWVLIDQGVGLRGRAQGETLRDQACSGQLGQHRPSYIQAAMFVPATRPFWRNAAHLAADQLDPAAMKVTAQV